MITGRSAAGTRFESCVIDRAAGDTGGMAAIHYACSTEQRHSRLSEKETARMEACKVQDMGDVVCASSSQINKLSFHFISTMPAHNSWPCVWHANLLIIG